MMDTSSAALFRKIVEGWTVMDLDEALSQADVMGLSDQAVEIAREVRAEKAEALGI